MSRPETIPVAADSLQISEDPAQLRAASKLQRLSEQLAKPAEKNIISWKDRLFFKQSQPIESAVQGVYLWGGVGRGKTWLMDQFYLSAPITGKLRMHFHRFLQLLHQELKSLAPQKDSLDRVAEKLAKQYRLLCLDEFQVSDMGDAMLLHGILRGLFSRGVVLVVTSNRHPDDLFKGGVLQEQILPSIIQLKRHTCIVHLYGDVDYRLLHKSQQSDWFFAPDNDAAEEKLTECFDLLSTGKSISNTDLSINNRSIKVRRVSDHVAWFDFDDLCNGPRAVKDYIQLAEQFRVVIVASVPALQDDSKSSARRFLNMVDEFYDRRIHLILSAATALDELYRGNRLKFEFQRTLSRLYEMQSQQYLKLSRSSLVVA